MSYFIAAISNAGGAPEQAYRKLQSAGACPENPYAGKQLAEKNPVFRNIYVEFVPAMVRQISGCGRQSHLGGPAMKLVWTRFSHHSRTLLCSYSLIL